MDWWPGKPVRGGEQVEPVQASQGLMGAGAEEGSAVSRPDGGDGVEEMQTDSMTNEKDRERL